MAFFNRKKADPSVLPEVDQYYSAERRDRAGLAWVLALVSIVIVAGLIVALFLGGRFVYNKLTDNNEETKTAETSDAPSFDGAPSPSNEPSEAPAPEPSDESEPSGDEELATETPATSTPRTTDLPHTGPAHTLVAFLAVTILAGGLHAVITSRKA